MASGDGPNPKHLLVDLDGTLLINRDVPIALNFIYGIIRELKPHGRWRALRALRASKSALKNRGASSATNFSRMVEAMALELGVDYESAEAEYRAALHQVFPRLARYFRPTPGAVDFLNWARLKYGPEHMTLATNPAWPLEIVELRMKWAQVLPEWFGVITHAEICSAIKPSAEYYRQVLSLVGAGVRPEDCLLVGDDPRMDLPATRLGIPVFIVDPFERTDRRPRFKLYPAREGRPRAWHGNYTGLVQLLTQDRD